MRRGLILLVTLVTACASAAPPPGGPEDKAPPQLLRVTPDTNAVNVDAKGVTFFFDETINDRGSGAQELDQYFLISPTDGTPHVDWHRNRIEVRPRHGFRPNTGYRVTLLPGLSDLRSNTMKTGTTLVFSTGPRIPLYYVKGTVFDWIAERPAPNAYLEAMTSDSVVYLALADYSGRFAIGPLNSGSYLVRGHIDQNGNRLLDRGEAFDTLRVSVPETSTIELLAAPRDTQPVRLLTVSFSDSVTLKVTFDRPLDPTQTTPPTAFRLSGSDSVQLPITAILSPRQQLAADSAARKAATDSVRHADSVAGKPLAPVVAPVPLAPARGAATSPPPTPSKPAPFASLTLKLGRPLAPNKEYRLSVVGLRSLSGRTQPSERRFTTPKPLPEQPPPKDSAAAKPPDVRPKVSSPPVTPPVRP